MKVPKCKGEGLSCSIVGGPYVSSRISTEGRGGAGAGEVAVYLRLLLIQRVGRERPL